MKKRYWAALILAGYTLVSVADHRIADYLHGVIVAEGAGYGTVMRKEEIDWDGHRIQIAPCKFQRKWLVYTYRTCFRVTINGDAGEAILRAKGPLPTISPLGLLIHTQDENSIFWDGVIDITPVVSIRKNGNKFEEKMINDIR